MLLDLDEMLLDLVEISSDMVKILLDLVDLYHIWLHLSVESNRSNFEEGILPLDLPLEFL